MEVRGFRQNDHLINGWEVYKLATRLESLERSGKQTRYQESSNPLKHRTCCCEQQNH